MSLLRKLLIVITLLVASLLLGNLAVSLSHSRGYFADQLSALAEDTATSLGLTLSHAASEKDIPQIQSMVNVIFDRGYYRSITYRDLNGNVIVERAREVVIEGIPQWFIDWIEIPGRSGSAEVISGWYRLGEVTVTVHPGYAYRDLWSVFKDQLRIFLFAAVLCYGLAGVGLKYLLRPLRNVEQQAEAICRKEFPVQESLPSTPELRRVVLAMNRMVTKVQEMFLQQVNLTETLRRDASVDPLTGLANRREFDTAMQAWLTSERGGSSGLIALLQLDGLAGINDRMGREFTDQLLQDMADLLTEATSGYPGALVSRRGGSDFCVFIPGILPDETDHFMSDMKSRAGELDKLALVGKQEVWLAGAYARAVSSVGNMLSAADTALREVKSGAGRNAQIIQLDVHAGRIRAAGEWLDYLRQVIDQGQILLHYQPVFAGDGKTLINHEVLCRVSDGNAIVNAGTFWPLVERFGLVEQFDKQVIAKALDVLSEHAEARLCVNISPQSLNSESFVEWAMEIMEQFALWEGGPILARLTFELPESALQLVPEKFTDFSRRVAAHNVGVGLDHFGSTPAAMAKLQDLELAYVKIDRRFVSDISADRENQFYVKTLVQIAKSCDIRILAEGVESEADWLVLRELGIEGGEGYLFGRPAPELKA